MELSQEELNERVAILKRFRTLLEQQRGKFQEYLTVLEKQQDSITTQNPDALVAHTELEQQVVQNIANLQKVIVPMTKMYNSVKNTASPSAANTENETEEINRIQNELYDLQNKVLQQNQLNRDLLRVQLTQIQTQINNFKNPYRNAKSVYAQKQPVAQMVEINI